MHFALQHTTAYAIVHVHCSQLHLVMLPPETFIITSLCNELLIEPNARKFTLHFLTRKQLLEFIPGTSLNKSNLKQLSCHPFSLFNL